MGKKKEEMDKLDKALRVVLDKSKGAQQQTDNPFKKK